MNAKSIDTRAELLALVVEDVLLLEQGLIEKPERGVDTIHLWRALQNLFLTIEGSPFVFLVRTVSELLDAGNPQLQAQQMLEKEYRREFIEAVTELCAYFHIQDEQESSVILQLARKHLERMQQLNRDVGPASNEGSAQESVQEPAERDGNQAKARDEVTHADDWGMDAAADEPSAVAVASSAPIEVTASPPTRAAEPGPPEIQKHAASGNRTQETPAWGDLPTLGEGTKWGLFDESPESPLAPCTERPQTQTSPVAPPAASLNNKASSGSPLSTPAAFNSKSLVSHYLVCCLGTQHYALPINCVREILAHRPERPLPNSRPGIIGLVTLRGQVFPVIDVSSTLFANRSVSSDAHPERRCMIVCEVEGRTFCFKVDEVKQVIPRSALPQTIMPLNQEQQIHRGISHASTYGQHSLLFVNMQEVIPA